MTKRAVLILVVVFLLLTPGSALAQDYYFNMPNVIVHVYWNEDGSMSIDYVLDFINHPNGHAIEFVDVALPNRNFNVRDIYADVNGERVTNISTGEYTGSGPGVGIGLGRFSIPPGQSGQVHVFIARVEGVLYTDDVDPSYASAVFSPFWYGSQYIYGTTYLEVTYHLPPGVGPDEGRWHSAPAGFNEEPDTGIDEDGRVLYTWRNPQASMDRQYTFGASFPNRVVPDAAVQDPGDAPLVWDAPLPAGGGFLDLGECLIPIFCFGFFGVIIFAGLFGERKRKLQYLPPKVSIEGHGIKRGLTAVEAAILMEQPMDKVMTMILFGVIKKGAAAVVSRDPLRLEITKPVPEGLRPYETEFVDAFRTGTDRERQRNLQSMMVALINSVTQKMKGFSRRETLAYYKDIQESAWKQVEAADTPEVKSQKFDENMEWTMLDKDYDRRTRDVFRTGPVYVPGWWGRYDPTYRPSTPSTPSTQPASLPGTPGGGGGFSRPNLPGGEFAASMVGGVESFSSRVVGNISDFTSRITSVTNPPPPPSSRSTGSRGGGGGGGGCACACACAGCACACAGGGR
jgi:hypothetical protein